jgi:hypothetical protein
VLDLPRSGRVACWLNGWLGGRVAPDQAITGIVGSDTYAVFAGLAAEPLTPALLLGELRRLGVDRAVAALPVPGDLACLAGPPQFNVDALEAGEAVILVGSGHGLVPGVDHHGVVWRLTDATPASYVPDVASADRRLRAELTRAADALAALDVASWSPDAADALLNLRAPVTFDAPVTFASGPAARLAATAARCREICRLALRDDGGALTAGDVDARRAALRPLAAAARAGLVAACSSLDGQ